MPIRTGCLADPCAPEASIIVQPHLTAGKKISDRCHRLPTAVRAGTDREDKIPKGEPGARLEDLPMSFHIVSVCFESSSGAIPHCEYLIHNSHAVIHSLCTLELTVQRHFCSIFKHKYPGPSTGHSSFNRLVVTRLPVPVGNQFAENSKRECRISYLLGKSAYEPERGFIRRSVNMYRAANITITKRIPFDC